MKKYFTSLFIVSFLILIAGSMNAQGRVGKIFSDSGAKILFGKVISSVDITVEDLREAVSNAGDYVYITIKNNQPVLTNVKRQSLIKRLYVPPMGKDEKMILFSKNAVEDFLNQISSTGRTDVKNARVNAAAAVSVERRGATTTLSANGYTLEMALGCPPFCN